MTRATPRAAASATRWRSTSGGLTRNCRAQLLVRQRDGLADDTRRDHLEWPVSGIRIFDQSLNRLVDVHTQLHHHHASGLVELVVKPDERALALIKFIYQSVLPVARYLAQPYADICGL